MSTSAVAGVDGCKAGWFYFCYDHRGLTYGIANSFGELADWLPDETRIFIDIPIGLIDSGESARECDRAARQLLGPRRSSIFSPPCRPVLQAIDYDEARSISQASIGKKLSKQSFFITPKIREVDDFLLQVDHGKIVREVHPELAFWGLNGRQPMTHNKKTQAGFEERLAILSVYIPQAASVIASVMQVYPRKVLLRDDIVDAMVCLLVARTSNHALQTVPAVVPRDSKGLAMEIVFTEHPDSRIIDRAEARKLAARGKADASHIN